MLDIIEQHFKNLKQEIIRLTQENKDLKKRLVDLEPKANALASTEKQVDDLKKKLSHARETKKNIQLIESLQDESDNAKKRCHQLEEELAAAHKKVEELREAGVASKNIIDRLDYIAQKLKIKRGSRNTGELLGAIEDRIRKISK